MRILAGVLATRDEQGRGEVPSCANLDKWVDRVIDVDEKYHDSRIGVRLVSMLMFKCGTLQLPTGARKPSLFHDSGTIKEVQARLAAALQASLDHEFPTWSRECARIDVRSPGFSWKKFVKEYVLPAVPVIISGLGAKELGRGVEAWQDIDYLRAHFGETVHQAGVFDSSTAEDRMGIMPRNCSDNNSWAAKHNNGEILRYTYKEGKSLNDLLDPSFLHGRSWFAEQSQIRGVTPDPDGLTDESTPPRVYFPEMWADLREPSFTKHCSLNSVNFWAGALDPAGVHKSKNSALHFDADDGFLHQISGNKTWTLFHRFDLHNLYTKHIHPGFALPPATGSKSGEMSGEDTSAAEQEHRAVMAGDLDVRQTPSNFSPVNPHSPDLERFPRFSRARPMTCRVGPAETIFIPAYTWHDVNSTHAPGEINGAVNFWTHCQTDGYDAMIELLHDTLRLGEWHRQYGAMPPLKQETLTKHPKLGRGKSEGKSTPRRASKSRGTNKDGKETKFDEL